MSFNENNLSDEGSKNTVLNFDLLNNIGGNDPCFLKDMLSTYSKTLNQTIELIECNYKKNNLTTIADAAHKMGPSCHSIGAEKLYNLFKDLEYNCRKNESHFQLETEVKAIFKEAKHILQEVDSKIESL